MSTCFEIYVYSWVLFERWNRFQIQFFVADYLWLAGKELYEHQQEMLEKHTEELSELTEKPNHSEFDRSHILNLTRYFEIPSSFIFLRVTERFMTLLLNIGVDGSHQLEYIS